MKGNSLLRLLVAIIIVAGLLGVMFSYQVRQNELAVVSRLGTLADAPTGPGLHFRWPWPFEQVHKYDCSVQTYEGDYTQLQTQDKQNILLGVYVCWRVADPIQYRNSLGGDFDAAQQALDNQVKSAVGDIVSKTAMDGLASLEPGGVKLESIEASVLAEVSPLASEAYGVEVLRVGVKRTALPEDVSVVVMENIRTQRRREAEEALSQGKATAKAITSEAEAVAEQVMSFARVRAREIQAQGQASAAEYYKRYGQEQEFAMFLRRLEHLKQTLKLNSMFILDGSQYDVSHGWFATPPTAESLGATPAADAGDQ